MGMSVALKPDEAPLIARKKVPSGCKQTDLGLIPSDWKIVKVEHVCRLVNGRGFKPHEWRERGLPIIRIQNLNGSTEFNFYDGFYDKKIEVEPGQLLFAWSGSRGTSFGPHIWQGPLGLLNYHTWKVVVDEAAVSPKFFAHALKGLTEFIEGQAHGASALVHVQKWQMEGFELALPQSVREQEAIAEALSDVDALIESMETLIAKKRAIKQGTMQDLLSGKKRLPGHVESWKLKNLGDLCMLKSGEGITSASIDQYSPYPCYGGNGLRGYTRTYTHDGRYALIGRVGALCGNVNLVTGRFFASEHAIVATPDGDTSVDWLALLLERMKLNRFSEASAQPVLTVTKLEKLEVFAPVSEDEQADIAQVVKGMTEEIDALQAKAEKARQIKQGMMQELLTGRIRLV